MKPGDVFVTNDPYAGGSHLPDITVVSPVHDERGQLVVLHRVPRPPRGRRGITPGSTPALSSSLEQEGVVLSALRLVSEGRLDWERILRVLSGGPHPARDPEGNLRDLEAQVAANATGARLLGDLARHHGADLVRAYMQHVQDDAAKRVEREIERRSGDGEHAFADALDDGTPIVASLRVSGRTMRVDFSGTRDAEVGGNLTLPERSPSPASCTSSAPSSARQSRSTAAASARSRSTSRPAAC